jgi:type II secretory pathway component PulF
MIYPAFIIVAMTGSVVIIMTIVVPKIVSLFGDASKLPQLTQMLISISDFMVAYWYL